MIRIVCSSKILHKLVSSFSLDHCKSQDKMKEMLMQNFGGTNKEYYGIFGTG